MVLLWRLTLNDGIQQTGFDRMTASSNVRRTRRKELLEAEQRSFTSPFHGRLKIAIGYPNSYHIAMSSLAYQWVVELAGHTQDLAVERFFFEPGMEAITMETGADLGVQDVLAWSYSFELDGVNILRTLDAAGIPRLAVERDQTFPLTVVGGPVASINPLPLSPAIDVFVLGAAELLWPDFIRLLKENPSRDDLLDHLAAKDGFFVPTRHLDGEGRPRHRVRRCEKRDFHMVQEDLVPASHIVTPHTEYA
ncbi:MAG: hypothetical protein GY906_37920, partial [bacterium]|nr:hypothetical protein [bacterium]